MLPAAFLFLVFLNLSFMLAEPLHDDGVAELSDRAVRAERGAFQFPHSVVSHHQAYRLEVFDTLFRAERPKCQSIKLNDSIRYHFDFSYKLVGIALPKWVVTRGNRHEIGEVRRCYACNINHIGKDVKGLCNFFEKVLRSFDLLTRMGYSTGRLKIVWQCIIISRVRGVDPSKVPDRV